MGGWQPGGGIGLGGGAGGGLLPGSPGGSENGGRQASERVAQAPRSPSFRSPWAAHELSTAPSSRGFGASPSAQPGSGFERGRGRHAEATFPAPLVRVRAARRQSRVSARPRPRAPASLAPLLPPLSGQTRPVSKAVSPAASRGRSGPKSAAAPLACGKCHQMAG